MVVRITEEKGWWIESIEEEVLGGRNPILSASDETGHEHTRTICGGDFDMCEGEEQGGTFKFKCVNVNTEQQATT